MIKLKSPANINGRTMPAGSIVCAGSAEIEAKFVKAKTAEYVNQQSEAEAKKKLTGKDKAPAKTDEFSREELNELASFMEVDQPEKLGDKAAVVEAIKASYTEMKQAVEAKPADAEANADTAVQTAATTDPAGTQAEGENTAENNTAEDNSKAEETQTQTTTAEKPIGRSSRKTE
jgi:hypothetical protein